MITLTTNKQNSADRAQGLRYFAYFRPLGVIQEYVKWIFSILFLLVSTGISCQSNNSEGALDHVVIYSGELDVQNLTLILDNDTIAGHLVKVDTFKYNLNTEANGPLESRAILNEQDSSYTLHFFSKDDMNRDSQCADYSNFIFVQNLNKVVDFPDEDSYPNYNLGAYIERNIEYPVKYQSEDIVVKIYVSAIVDRNGELINVEVYKPWKEEFDIEAVRVVESSPKWIPAMYNGFNVKSKVRIPVHFKID